MVQIADVARVVGGATPKSGIPGYWDGDVRWATPKDLSGLELPWLDDTPRKITTLGLKSCSSELLPAGSVLFSSRAPIGHVAINTVPVATNQGFKSFIPGEKLNASFLYWWLRCHRSYLEGLGNGATFKEVSKAVVERIAIPLPPLPEQKRIAAILDQADGIRRKLANGMKMRDHLRDSIFKSMFGDPVENPNDWETSSYREVSKRITVGVVVKPASYYVEDGVPAIRGTNIKAGGIDLSDAVYFSHADNIRTHAKTRIWQGDLVIVRSGRPGLAAVVPEELDGINAIDVLILTPDHRLATPRFLCDLINSASGRRMILSESRGQVQQHFNVGSLSKAPLFVPPLKLQKAYEDTMRDVDDSFHRLRMSAQLTASLFTSLQHRAFRGEL